MTATLDPRTNAVRPDLADSRLRGQVAAARFVDGALRRLRTPSAPLHQSPGPDAPIVTEAIHGELVRVFDEQEGWAWAQLDADSYVGWMSADALGPVDPPPTHRVAAIRAFVFPRADLKLPPRTALPFGSLVALGEETVTRGTPYRLLAGGGGAIPSAQVAPLDAAPAPDYVSVAEIFLGIPYLWGGRTSFGFDCSGLVQTSLAAAGSAVPRDTDMQERTIGRPVDAGMPPARGDLVFWKGHVGIVSAPDRLLHANAHHMAVAIEPLAGIAAPRDTDMQERAIGRPAEGSAGAPLARGDLVFWKGHVGIVSAPDRLLHANAHHMAVDIEPLAGALARIGPPTSIRRL